MNIRNKLKNIDDDSKVILRNSIMAFIVKGGALVVSLFTMPAFMRYFDDQQVLGVWFTLLSVLTWILSFDLGIGNGLRNKLVEAFTKNLRDEAKNYISSAYFTIGMVVAVVTAIGLIVAQFINWNSIFNISTETISQESLKEVMCITFVGIMIHFFLKLITSIFYALQKSAVNNALALFTSVLQLGFILLVPSISPEKNLIILSYGYIIFTNLPYLVASIIIFTTALKDCRPNIKNMRKAHIKSVLTMGGLFFWCQIMYMIIVNTNEFFITQFAGPQYVVDYQIYYKLFSLIGMLFSLALTPIWSSITKAMVENSFKWLSNLYKKMKLASLLAIALEFLFIFALQLVINLWLREKAIKVDYFVAIVFACFGSLFIYQTTLSTVVCGLGRMKLQAIFYTVAVVAKFVIIYFGMKIFNNWIVVVASNAIILLPYCIIQQISLDRYIKKKLFLGE